MPNWGFRIKIDLPVLCTCNCTLQVGGMKHISDFVVVVWSQYCCYMSKDMYSSVCIAYRMLFHCLKGLMFLISWPTFSVLYLLLCLECCNCPYYYTRLMPLCPGLPGWAGTRKVHKTNLDWWRVDSQRCSLNHGGCEPTCLQLRHFIMGHEMLQHCL